MFFGSAVASSSRREPPCRRSARASTLLALALAALGVLAASASARASDRQASTSRRVLPIAVSVAPRVRGARVPKDFLGLSFEIKHASQIAALATHGDLVTLLRSLGRGLVRLGGVTADTQVAWSNDGRSIPPWANTAITAQDLDSLGQLVHRAGWRALLTVNLGHHDPISAAQEAAAAHRAFGPALAGIELGNEPDAFVAPDGLRSAPWGFPDYRAEVDAYRAAFDGLVSQVPIAGPDAASGRSKIANWIIPEAKVEHPALLTGHYYSFSCTQNPTAVDLLLPSVRRAEGAMFRRLAEVSARRRIPLRVDETNNVSCGGLANVSDTFASSLWAVDFLTRAMSAGLAGINFHDVILRPQGYSPLVAASLHSLASGHLEVRPEWYALLMASQLVGRRPLPASVRPAGLNVTASAFGGPGEVKVVIVDDQPRGARTLSVRLSLPRRYTSGTVLRLTAPSSTATSGVTLGGRSVSASGAWRPRRRLPRLTRSAGALRVTMTPGSAALITLASAPARG
jgi:hypothetical protein